MKFRTKHRKLFYVPGMISLVLIPLLFVCYFCVRQSFKNEGSMDLGLMNKEEAVKFQIDYKLLYKRNFRDFVFNGSLDTEESNLARFQRLLRQQNTIKDSVNGLRLQLGKQMKYEVFIRLLDILTIEDTPTYMLNDDEFVIFNSAPSDIERQRKIDEEKYGPRTQMNCGTQAYMDRQRRIDEANQKLIDNENFQKSFLNRHWYLFLAYFGIVVLNLYVLIKFNKNRNYNQKSYI